MPNPRSASNSPTLATQTLAAVEPLDAPKKAAKPRTAKVTLKAESAAPIRGDGRRRVVIEGVLPEVDGGRYAIKRTVGETVVVEADLFTDGHDAISAVLLYRDETESGWKEAPFEPTDNDRWRGEFPLTRVGRSVYTVQGWVDHFKSWRRDLGKRVAAGQDVGLDLLVGAALVEAAATRASNSAPAPASDARQLQALAAELRSDGESDAKISLALSDELRALVELFPDRHLATTYERELPVKVDREKARFSAWYELFPRSCSPEPGRHGTFEDVEARLPYVAEMGFDVLYFPPIHPIGHAHRKGRNNSLVTETGDVGSPWAIGSQAGGHKAIHPELGTLEDFRRLVARAGDLGIDIALDIAFQCSPDHPYVREHPEWFRHRPDGTIQYAENPPKKYQDIYPFDFETEGWQELWHELTGVVLYWVQQGVRVFRVDNPHTKTFPFWEFLIAQVQKQHPDTIFLAEAFTRPKVMGNLAKLGFTQSYTYFTWRNTKAEIEDYFTELTQTPLREFFRPNPWPNTPDILAEHLQFGGRPAAMSRLVLAATLAATYGIYGPTYELCQSAPHKVGGEEYLDSEKYEIRQWNLDDPRSIRPFIARINQIRRENVALQNDRSLRFHTTDNEQIICYSKRSEDKSSIIVVVVNLDVHHGQAGWVSIPVEEFGLDAHREYQVHDLLDDARYLWQGARNYVELSTLAPAHIFRIQNAVGTERDFDNYG